MNRRGIPTTDRPMTLLRAAAGLLALTLLVVGCGPDETTDEDTGTTPMSDADVGTSDTMPDGTGDTSDAGDTTVADATDAGDTADGADTTTFTCAEPTPTPVAEAEEHDIFDWVVGSTGVAGGDPIGQAIRDGSFEVPTAGTEKYGTEWTQAFPEDDGAIPTGPASGSVYAATNIRRREATTMFAKADEVYRVYVNGRVLPGDVYGHGDKRIPIPLVKGDNPVVVQFVPRLNPKVEFFTTDDKLRFNPRDITKPDLRVGHKTEQPLGLPIVNLGGEPMYDVKAKVVENEHFQATTVSYPAIGADAVTQIGFDLKPKKKWAKAEETIPVKLRLETCSWSAAYETTVDLETVAPDANFRRTFRSPIDHSIQYYGVVPPKDFAAGKNYGMVLSLHGASVEAKGQANAYSQKDWAYIVAPTNRRRFGFDWEEWGRLNGMSALDDAMGEFQTDPTKVYVTGHSMGGHGTWHFGVMHPGRFATVGPSAGWQSFYTYGAGGGSDKPSGAIGRARAHSETSAYMSNLANRAGYIIHGSADRNVPVEEGRRLRDMLKMYTDDVKYHEEEGAKHWWNGDRADGADCVDWPPLFTFMKNHSLDPHELDFKFTSPGPWASDEHSYVQVRSSSTPMNDVVLESEKTADKEVTLTTQNVRSMVIDGKALADKGIDTIIVDGDQKMVSGSDIDIGPTEGKTTGMNGTFNQAFHKPFCFVYAEGDTDFRNYAAFLTSIWSYRGNGHACTMPLSRVTDDIRASRNMIYLGVPFDRLPESENLPFGWTDSSVSVGDNTYQDSAGIFAFRDGDRMAAAMVANEKAEQNLFGFQPFSSRSGMPDYLIFSSAGGQALGFFDNQWEYDASLGQAR